MPKMSAKLKRGHPNAGAKCRWVRLNAVAVAEIGNFRRQTLSTYLGRKLITLSSHLHVRRDAVRRAGLSATADPCYGRPIGQAIIFLPCGFFLLSSSYFPRLISAVAEWMSTILRHMMWS